MGNYNVGGSKPLLSPQSLWGKQPQPPAVQPGSQQAIPTTLPPLPVGNASAGNASLSQPDSVSTSLPKLPIGGQTPPPVSFATEPTVSPGQSLQGQAQQLRGLLKSADQDFFNQLSQITKGQLNLQLVKNANGQISGYQLNGQTVSRAQVQQSLLPMAGQLHQALEALKGEVQGKYQSFFQTVNQQFAQMTPQEQTSVNIQLQAINVLYESFLNRLGQVDGLIK